MSYKRARGPLGNNKSGNPVWFLRQESVKSKDKTNVWSNTPSAGVTDILLSAHLPEDGHPNVEELRDVYNYGGIFLCSIHTKYHEPYV